MFSSPFVLLDLDDDPEIVAPSGSIGFRTIRLEADITRRMLLEGGIRRTAPLEPAPLSRSVRMEGEF